MAYNHNRHNNNNNGGGGIEWGITLCVAAALVIITGLPSVVVGLLLWWLTPRTSWTWYLWFVLTLAGAGLIFYFYTHGLERMLIKEWSDYYLAFLHANFDVRLLPLHHLWPETWPIWLRTLPAAGFVALLQETNAQRQPGQTQRKLEQEEQRRLRRIDRRGQRARRQAQRPEHVPDAIGGSMVIGVVIDDQEQE